MKVLFFANTAWYLYNFRMPFARFLRERGFEVVMVAPEGPYGDRLEAAGFRWIRVPMDRRSLHPGRELRVLLYLTRLYGAERPDLVHHFTIKCVVYGSVAARLRRIGSRVNAVVGMGYVFASDDLRARLLRPLVSALLGWVARGTRARLIFQNADDFATLRRGSVARDGHMRLIRGSGVDTCRFRPRVPGREPAVTRVLLAARLVAGKGVHEFAAAAQALTTQGLAVEFLLAGEPDPGNPGAIDPALVREWESKGWLRHLGHVEDMAALLQEVDIAVLPSYGGEGVPRGLVEAAACGLPLVATDVPGCRDIVDHGITGVLVPAGDCAALARAIAGLHDDPDSRRRMGAAGREKVLQEFDETIVHERTLQVYRELVGKTPSAERQQGAGP